MLSSFNVDILTYFCLYNVNFGSQSNMTRHCVYVKFTYLMRLNLMTCNTLTNPKYCTRSPFLTWLSRRAKSGRRTSYRQSGVVHRNTQSLCYFLFICFICSFYSRYKNGVLYPVKQLDHFRGNWHSHFSVPPHTALVHDCFRTGSLSSIICSAVSPFKSLPSYLSPTVLNISWQMKQNVRLWTVRNWRQQT